MSLEAVRSSNSTKLTECLQMASLPLVTASLLRRTLCLSVERVEVIKQLWLLKMKCNYIMSFPLLKSSTHISLPSKLLATHTNAVKQCRNTQRQMRTFVQIQVPKLQTLLKSLAHKNLPLCRFLDSRELSFFFVLGLANDKKQRQFHTETPRVISFPVIVDYISLFVLCISFYRNV